MKKWKDLSKKGKKTKIFYMMEYIAFLLIMVSGLTIVTTDIIIQKQHDFESMRITDPHLFYFGFLVLIGGLILMKLSDITYNQNKEV